MSVWLILFLFFDQIEVFRSSNFTIFWDKSQDTSILGYKVSVWDGKLKAKIYDAGNVGWCAIPRKPEVQWIYVTAYTIAGIESLPSKIIFYPSFKWQWWNPPYATQLQTSVDLITWKSSDEGIPIGPFLFVEVPAINKRFFRLRINK